jgi:transaldolase
LLANDTAGTIAAAKELHARAGRPNLFIKIPGTDAGLGAIEESIFAGVPVNVTLLFSSDQYVGAAEAYMRAIERRLAAKLDPAIFSVASLFVSRWDVAVAQRTPDAMHNRLVIAVAKRAYYAYLELLNSQRWLALASAGAKPQRLLWASTGTKDPQASDVLYVEALAAPNTINTIPESTLNAFADHGVADSVLSPADRDYEAVLAEFFEAGIDLQALAAQLQVEGAQAFAKSWNELMACLASKREVLTKAG